MLMQQWQHVMGTRPSDGFVLIWHQNALRGPLANADLPMWTCQCGLANVDLPMWLWAIHFSRFSMGLAANGGSDVTWWTSVNSGIDKGCVLMVIHISQCSILVGCINGKGRLLKQLIDWSWNVYMIWMLIGSSHCYTNAQAICLSLCMGNAPFGHTLATSLCMGNLPIGYLWPPHCAWVMPFWWSLPGRVRLTVSHIQ